MKKAAILLLALAAPAFAQGGLANLKIVTDANPDYSDMESMTRSITLNQKTDADKMYALFYWDYRATRYTWAPPRLHSSEITDPIRQFNDYGHINISGIPGTKCSTWRYMGYPCRYFGIISDVWYDRRYHAYDNGFSAVYTLQDNKTIASVDDLGASLAGPESNNQPVPGFLALYRCLNGTGPNAFLQGSDSDRPLKQMADNYVAAKTARYGNINQERGHRYILNLRPGEIFTRYYSRQDDHSRNAIQWDPNNPYKSDPGYFSITAKDPVTGRPFDPEMIYPAYRVRGNGERIFTPPLDESRLPLVIHSSTNIKGGPDGLRPAAPGLPATAIFKIEGANVITSLRIRSLFSLATAEDSAAISLSTNNGLTWTELWKSARLGESSPELRLIDEVNGTYEALVKINLNAKNAADAAALKSISFNTITQLNTKTLPQLNIGANNVYVGLGEQTDSIVHWPDLNNYKKDPILVDQKNIRLRLIEWGGPRLASEKVEPAYVVYKFDTPTDITGFTIGGRFLNQANKSRIEFAHSFDNGKSWHIDGTVTEKAEEIIRYETLRDLPPGNRSVLLKVTLVPEGGADDADIYSLRMEVNHRLNGPAKDPLEVTFNYRERQNDFSLVPRSHTQLIEKFPTTYHIDVNGADHPVVDSLTIAYKGSRPDITYGYTGIQSTPTTAPATAPSTEPATAPVTAPAPQRWIAKWATYGNNLALKKPYTLSAPSSVDWWGCGDPQFKRLTDGLVGPPRGVGGFVQAAAWSANTNPVITVDLGELKKCAAFRIQTVGYDLCDAMKGESKDKIELLTSADGKTFTSQGFFKTRLRYKNLPVNFVLPEDDALTAPDLTFAPEKPVDARYVKYKITSPRIFGATEVQVLDSYSLTPWDLNIALPDPAQNGKAPPKPDLSPNARKFEPADRPPAPK